MKSHSTEFVFPKTDLFIDGDWRPARSVYRLINPADGEEIAEVADCDAGDAADALDAAAKAQPAWGAVAPRARADLMHAAHRLMLSGRRSSCG